MRLPRSLTIAAFFAFAAALFGSPVFTVPPGLSPGQQYRIIFVTSTTTTATSTAISDYDTFVTNAADASALGSLGATWQAVASTSAVSASTHIGSADVPIFLVDGTEVAASTLGLWSPSGLLAASGIDLTEQGTAAGLFTWTGTGPDGSALDPLGSVAAVVEGCTITPDHTLWIDAGSPAPRTELPLYGISSVLTVATPEPGYFGILSAALLLLGARRQLARHRR